MRIGITRLVSKEERKEEKQNKKILQNNYIYVAYLAYNNAIL